MHKWSAHKIASEIHKGNVSATDVVKLFLRRIEVLDAKVGALLHVLKDRSLKKAHAIDQKRARKEPLGKLAGVPVIIKDNMHVKDEKTTCASKILEHYVAPFNSTVVSLIENEDGIILGKANLDEFAMGSSTENSAFQKTYNPWNLKCTPGGSSGGSGVSVAAMFTPLALGSDTGGSIRQPASFLGIYGFKPTYGRVSRFGLVAFGSSLDQIGPFARCVEDIALMQEVIAKPCPYDSNSLQDVGEPYLDELKTSIQGKTLGIPHNILEGANNEVKKAFENAVKVFKDLGVHIVDVHLDMLKYANPVYYILATAEASTNLARYDGIRYTTRSKKAKTLEEVYELSRSEGFGEEVKRRIFLGTFVLSAGYQDAYYRKAQKVRTLLIEDYRKVFARCDAILTPTTPTPAFELGAIQDPLQMYMQDVYTISTNLVGIPAINIPIGFTASKMPIGMQIQGPQLHDARVLRFAYHFEKATNFMSEAPPEFDIEIGG